MKKLYTLIVAALFAATLAGQSPEALQYQAVVRDATGEIITIQVGMRITILQGSSTGTPVCEEVFTPTPNDFGLVNIEIGTVNPASFAAIDWSAGPYFVKVELDHDGSVGGISYDVMGTSQLLSVPYALYAKNAGTYTETDPVFEAHPANGITTALIGNWNTAYGWGDHSGLYRPLGYVPSWSEITSNPFSIVSPANDQLLKYNTTSGKFENWTPGYLTSFSETDPEVGVNTTNYLSKWNGSALVGSAVFENGYFGYENPAALDTDVETEIALKTGNYWTGLIKTIGEGSAYARMGLFTWASPDKNDLLERLSILDNGNVGIGKTDPEWSLDVNGQVRFTGHLISNNERGSLILNSGPDNSSEGLAGIFFRKTDVQGDPTNYTELMRITDDGEVGIGTTNPIEKLQINDGIDKNIGIRNGDWLFGSEGIGLTAHNDAGTTLIPLGAVASKFAFLGGNVGIGTVSPLAKLSFGDFHFPGESPLPAEQTGTLRLYDNGDGAITYGFGVSTNSLNIAANQAGGLIRLWTNGTERARVSGSGLNIAGTLTVNGVPVGSSSDSYWNLIGAGPNIQFSSGNVGIGTSTPGSKLDVVGYINTDLNSGYSINGSPVLRIIGPETNTLSLLVGLGAGQNMPSNLNLINIAVGNRALFANTTGAQNTAIGDAALWSNLSGHYNIGVGRNALGGNITGSKNTAVGTYALSANVDHDYNTAVGSMALQYNKGGGNTAIGDAAGMGTSVPQSTFSASVLVGSCAGQKLTTGQNITAIGYSALTYNTSGNFNSAVGYYSLGMNTIGNKNTAVGNYALALNTEGIGNSALGDYALYSNTFGQYNVAIGDSAFYSNITARYNTVIGASALKYNKAYPGKNTALGFAAGYGVSTLSNFENNVLIGYKAGFSLQTGGSNLLIGYQAGYNITTGSNNIIIGRDISTPTPTSTNHMNIGDVIFGELGMDRIGIGIIYPQYKLDVAGDVNVTGNFKVNGVNIPASPADGSETKVTAGTNVTVTGTGTGGDPYVVNATGGGGGGGHYIGESYGGGVVFYVYDDGQHGLIAATADQSSGVKWNNGTELVTNAVRDKIGAGMNNTERIIGVQGAGAYAAQLCANYQGGNYGDWYLPSQYELNLLWMQKDVIGGLSGIYWSSNEVTNDSAYIQLFDEIGSQMSLPKSNTLPVRAIRTF